MWFKSAFLYRFTKPFYIKPSELEAALTAYVSRPCGAMEMATIGFHPVHGNTGAFVIESDNCLLFAVRKEEKIMPATAIAKLVNERIDAIEKEQGRHVGKNEKAEIKNKVVAEVSPKALVTESLIRGYFDFNDGWLVVDTSTPGKADEFTFLLRQALGSLPITPPTSNNLVPEFVMQRLVCGQYKRDDLTVGDYMEVIGAEKAQASFRNTDIGSEEVLSYLDHEGAMPKKLSLTWDDRVSFVICADLSIKRLKFLDLVQSEAMEQEVESVEERFAADFAIMSGELRKVLARLTDVFVIETELEDVA
jgi:recombination associated protein RdgC